MIKLKGLLREYKSHDRFVVVKGYNDRPFTIGVGSHTQNPNATDVVLPKGTIIEYETTADNGNVWFYFTHPTTHKYMRGKTESGSVDNMIRAGIIKLK